MVFKIKEKVEECVVAAEKYYNIKIPRPLVRFDLTGTTAGQSCYAKKYLRFNLKLSIANEKETLENTTPHEVAHYVQRHIHGYAGIKPHGREWAKIMLEVYRLSPKRTHKMDTSAVARKTKSYKYSCNCSNRIHSLGGIRHKKALRGAVFCCNFCRAELSFEGRDTKSATPPVGNKFLREEIL